MHTYMDLTLTLTSTPFALYPKSSQNLRPNHVVMKRPERIGEYDPARDRSNWSLEDEDEEDAVILSELFADVVVLSRARIDVPAQDELPAGLRIMVDGSSFESMPMYAIFAAQILLDINHRLRSNVSYPLNRLRIAGETAIDSVDQHFQHVDGQCQAEMRNTKDEELKDIKVYTEEWIQTDAIGAAFSKGTASQATIPPFRFFRNHPMLCGLKVFRLQMLLQGIGIGLCNAWGSVIFPAHLYNAVACSMEEHLRWIDLIYIVSLHSAKRVFGGSPPTRPVECFDRFILGLDPTDRARTCVGGRTSWLRPRS